LRELIDQASDVMIMGHENCDIDCLGAALGIYRVAKNRNKEAHIVLNSSNPTIDVLISKIEKSGDYEGLFIAKEEAIEKISKKTLLIIVDTHRPSFTEFPELLSFAHSMVKATLSESKELNDLYTSWLPNNKIPFHKLAELFKTIDKQIKI